MFEIEVKNNAMMPELDNAIGNTISKGKEMLTQEKHYPTIYSM